VYWFSRPPYLRWAGAVLLIVAAAWVDLRPAATTPYPFARADLASGTAIDAGSVEWRQVPVGLLPADPPLDGTVRYAVAAGEPLLPSLVAAGRPEVPEGWWALSTTLPEDVVAGQALQLVVTGFGVAPRAFPAIVVEPPPPHDPLGYDDPVGLVAVPGDSAATVAAAAADGEMSVLIGPAP
jgi:hypothetical protein